MKTSGKELCRGKSRLGKRKCADVGPKHTGDSQRSGRKTYKTGDCLASGGKYTKCRNKITGTTKGADGRKPNPKKYSRGRKWNGRRDRNNGSTNIRAAARCGEGKCRMVSADGGREKFRSSSDYTGVLKKAYKMAGRCWGVVDKVCHV